MRFKTSASILAAAGLLLAAGGVASAQTSTTGAVRGLVKDQASGETVIGATVVASGPALQGTQATITDDSGQYFVANLPPGIYQVVVYYADAQFSRTNVLIQLGKVAVVNININTQAAAGETIVIEGRAPLIDQQSTKTGNTITKDYTDNVPTGRTFGAVLGAAGGTQGDLYGTSVGGSTSVENTYIVEGVNTTDPGYGPALHQPAERVHPGDRGHHRRVQRRVRPVDRRRHQRRHQVGLERVPRLGLQLLEPGGAGGRREGDPARGCRDRSPVQPGQRLRPRREVGGPIVKDKLWFHAGFNPHFASTDVDPRHQDPGR
jgi:hypothetical protein